MPSVTWLGHATVVIDLPGVKLVTDPVLRRRVGPLVRTVPDPPAGALADLDGVLLSHLHADHADPRSLRALGRAVPVLAPRPAGAWLRRLGLEQVRELSAGETSAVGEVAVEATPAAHAAARGPLGSLGKLGSLGSLWPAADPIGYLVHGAPSIYFAGDTDLFPGMAELAGWVDLALVPVWGWGPSVGAGHLDPERAARAVALIAPRIAVPVHWGTLALPWATRRPGARDGPAREFARLAGRYAPEVEVRILAPGETTEL